MATIEKDLINFSFRLTRRQIGALAYVLLFVAGLVAGFAAHNAVYAYFMF